MVNYMPFKATYQIFKIFLNDFVKEHENGKTIKQGEEGRTC
jgi:hypothetical protein